MDSPHTPVTPVSDMAHASLLDSASADLGGFCTCSPLTQSTAPQTAAAAAPPNQGVLMTISGTPEFVAVLSRSFGLITLQTSSLSSAYQRAEVNNSDVLLDGGDAVGRPTASADIQGGPGLLCEEGDHCCSLEKVLKDSRDDKVGAMRPRPRDILLRVKDGWDPATLAATLDAVAKAMRMDHASTDADPQRLQDSSVTVCATGWLEKLEGGAECLHPSTLTLDTTAALHHGGFDEATNVKVFAVIPQHELPQSKVDSGVPATTIKQEAETKPRTRAARGNAKRAVVLAQFLIDTYGIETLRSGTGVIDVAGGSGELSFELSHIRGIPCTTVDPRLPRWTKQQRRQIAVRKEWIRMLEAAPSRSPLHAQMLSEWLSVAPRHIRAFLHGREDVSARQTLPPTQAAAAELLLGETGGAVWLRLDESEGVTDVAAEAAAAVLTVLNCSVIVGLHPDQPTAALVDCAGGLGKPFVVLPCCVFPDRYFHRRTCGHADRKAVCNCGDRCTAVRTHGDLCRHLTARGNDGTETTLLDFGGRNVVVYNKVRP